MIFEDKETRQKFLEDTGLAEGIEKFRKAFGDIKLNRVGLLSEPERVAPAVKNKWEK